MADPAFEHLPFLDAEPWRVAVVNPTGRYARNQVAGLLAAGTPILGGVALGRDGQSMDGLPLVDRVAELPEANVALVYTPPDGFRDAVADCIAARIRTIVAVAEYVPVHDALYALAEAVRGFRKPVVAMLVGRHAPAEKRMGHAGALVGSAREGADAKLAALAAAGCRVATGPEQAVAILKELGLGEG
jgi:succinyl-CoA synthetase alpha subunit